MVAVSNRSTSISLVRSAITSNGLVSENGDCKSIYNSGSMVHTLMLVGDSCLHSCATCATLAPLRPVITTMAPYLENSRAIWAPMPPLEPVMSTTLPPKSCLIVAGCFLLWHQIVKTMFDSSSKNSS